MANSPKAKRQTQIVTNEIAITAAPAPRATRSETMISLMRLDGGASAKALAEAVGWQVHSVRGFIAGTLRKRSDLIVTAVRAEGGTRYQVVNADTTLNGGWA